MKKRTRKQRKVSKPTRPSKSLKSLQSIAKAHRWLAMVTFKPPATTDEKTSNQYQKFLVDLFRRELRGKSIGFLLVREFGTGQSGNELGDRSHFHVVVTNTLPEDTLTKIKRRFLHRCGLANNQSRAFNYIFHTANEDPNFGGYVSKLKKDGIDIIHPPIQWNFRFLSKPYHFGYLNKYIIANNKSILTN